MVNPRRTAAALTMIPVHEPDRRMATGHAKSPYPKFHNDFGIAEIRIGAREFHCIGETPPQDHPHIYINMGDRDESLCPYCSTLYRFDGLLGPAAADPPEAGYVEH